MPIIDPEIDYKRKNVKNEQKKNSISTHIKSWSESSNNWKSVIAIDYLLKDDQSLAELIDWRKIVPSPLLAEIFNQYSDDNLSIPINTYTSSRVCW